MAESILRRVVRNGLLKAIGKHGDDWVLLNAAKWHIEGVITVEDLAEIEAIIDAKNGEREVAGDDLKV